MTMLSATVISGFNVKGKELKQIVLEMKKEPYEKVQ